MATDKQIAANRANAQKCCGPTSPAGRAVSSQNALKHGLDSKSEVMRAESRADYETLITEYYERFNPTVPEDRALVDMLIKSEWHSRRYMSIDAGIWERGFLDTSTDELSLGRVFERSDKVFDRVGRRINSAQRNFQNALKQLLDIRAKRAKEPALDLNQLAEPTALAEPVVPLDPASILDPIAPLIPSRDRQGAVPEPPQPAETPQSAIATKPLNHKLVSFLQNAQPAADPPASAPESDQKAPADDETPPLAA